MGRRTAWSGREAGRARPAAHARVAGTAAYARVAVTGMVLCLTAALAGPSAVAADATTGYAFAPDARQVVGATGTADASTLRPGTAYRDSLPADGRLYYRLDTGTSSNAYVSATAVPPAGTTVSATDGIKVTVQDDDGRSCSFESASIGASRSPHPVTAVGVREVSPGSTRCQGPGPYYVLVERVTRTGSSTDAWDLELAPVSEPPLEHAAATTTPGTWDSSSPEPVSGEAEYRRGGAGFSAARTLGQGVWRDGIRPGQTLFYKVPVDWGRQLYATAELAGAGGGTGYVPGAMSLALYNPVRGPVADAGTGYNGSRKSAALEPLPPVAYANRYAVSDRVNTMRFAGSYYLVVHLAAAVAERFGDGELELTLRVRVKGMTQAGPAYAGDSEPEGVFAVSEQDRVAADPGRQAAGGDTAMRLLAVGGIGGGTLVLVVLGVWTLVGRRGRVGRRAVTR